MLRIITQPSGAKDSNSGLSLRDVGMLEWPTSVILHCPSNEMAKSYATINSFSMLPISFDTVHFKLPKF